MESKLLSDYYQDFQKERNKNGTVKISERLQFIKKEVGEHKRVIELGCRFGSIIELFYENNDVAGVDIDNNALEICKKKFPDLNIFNCDLNARLPFDDNTFDVVVITEVLEHLPYTDITLSEIKRILKPEGKIVGSVPNATRLRNRLRFLSEGVVEKDPTHLIHFSSKLLNNKLSKYFDNVEVRPIASRFLFLSKNMFANYLLFKGNSKTRTQE